MTELYTKTSSGVERIDVSVPKIEERVTNLESNKLGKTEKAASALVADSATKATQDGSGNVISSTYATKSEVTSGLSGKLGKTEKASSANTADAVAWAGVTGKPSFATVATTGSYNDLTDKPSISSGKAYITEVWSSATNWYRVWSNGCIEQGGLSQGGDRPYTWITLHKAYSNTNYNILISTSSSEHIYIKAKEKGTVKFNVYSSGNVTYMSVYWYTIGW